MGRPKGSRNKRVRAKARTPYQTYSDWYDKYTKGAKKSLFRDKLTPEEFREKYERAKELGMKNPARAVAMAQERISRQGEKNAKEFYGGKLPDLTTEADREQFFIDYYTKMQGDTDLNHDEIEESFKQYYY